MQVLQPRCELCTHVDPAPRWQCVGRTVDFLAEGRTVPAGGARLYAAVTPHYPDAAGNTWVTRCAGCCLATDVRNILQEYTLQVPARQALRQAVDIFERRHVYRVPGPPPEVREPRNVGDDGAGPPPPPLEAPEASVDEFGRKWTCTLHTNPDWDVTDPLGRASRAAPRDGTPPTPPPSNVDFPRRDPRGSVELWVDTPRVGPRKRRSGGGGAGYWRSRERRGAPCAGATQQGRLVGR